MGSDNPEQGHLKSSREVGSMLIFISKAFIQHCENPVILWNLYKQIKEPFFFSSL